ncbi:MAG: EF-P lysine aminoacylase EpmA [Pseudomonadota bacterium]
MTDCAAPLRPWSPSASAAAIRARASLYRSLRAFFAAREVLEVDTPILSRASGTDPALAPLAVQRCAGRPAWLHTSPEFAMKRLLASGIGDIYQLCHVFRDDECGRHHNPEFTMLEWYRLGYDHHRLMDEVDALLHAVVPPARLQQPTVRTTFHAAVADATGLDSDMATAREFRDCLASAGVPVPEACLDDREALLDLVLGDVVGPTLGEGGPVMVYDYPASRAALAKVRPGTPARAERFEVYLRGIELANGFHELTDSEEQRRRFVAESAARERAGLAALPIDEALLAALERGLPACAGVALGVDRLLMLMLGVAHLDEVLAFPLSRA